MNPSRPIRTRVARVSLLALAFLTGLGAWVAAGSSASAQDKHPEYNAYHPSSRLLTLDGEPVERARVYDRYVKVGRNKSHHSCLVTDVPGYGALIVKRMGLRVLKVRPEDITVNDDLSRDLKLDAALTELGPVRIDPQMQWLLFDLVRAGGSEPVRGVIKDAPMLLGWKTLQEVLDSNKRFNAEVMMYTPDPESLAKLASVGGAWRVDMYFGTWCTQCERYLPRIIATAHTHLAAMKKTNPKATEVSLRFYGLPPVGGDPGYYDDPEVKARSIGKLPAGLIYKSGQLVGRIEGTNWENPAAALYAVLSSVSN
ncbi:MAG: hypothetical protein AB7T63_03365 [Planctomycetota bacterium]